MVSHVRQFMMILTLLSLFLTVSVAATNWTRIPEYCLLGDLPIPAATGIMTSARCRCCPTMNSRYGLCGCPDAAWYTCYVTGWPTHFASAISEERLSTIGEEECPTSEVTASFSTNSAGSWVRITDAKPLPSSTAGPSPTPSSLVSNNQSQCTLQGVVLDCGSLSRYGMMKGPLFSLLLSLLWAFFTTSQFGSSDGGEDYWRNEGADNAWSEHDPPISTDCAYYDDPLPTNETPKRRNASTPKKGVRFLPQPTQSTGETSKKRRGKKVYSSDDEDDVPTDCRPAMRAFRKNYRGPYMYFAASRAAALEEEIERQGELARERSALRPKPSKGKDGTHAIRHGTTTRDASSSEESSVELTPRGERVTKYAYRPPSYNPNLTQDELHRRHERWIAGQAPAGVLHLRTKAVPPISEQPDTIFVQLRHDETKLLGMLCAIALDRVRRPQATNMVITCNPDTEASTLRVRFELKTAALLQQAAAELFRARKALIMQSSDMYCLPNLIYMMATGSPGSAQPAATKEGKDLAGKIALRARQAYPSLLSPEQCKQLVDIFDNLSLKNLGVRPAQKIFGVRMRRMKPAGSHNIEAHASPCRNLKTFGSRMDDQQVYILSATSLDHLLKNIKLAAQYFSFNLEPWLSELCSVDHTKT